MTNLVEVTPHFLLRKQCQDFLALLDAYHQVEAKELHAAVARLAKAAVITLQQYADEGADYAEIR